MMAFREDPVEAALFRHLAAEEEHERFLALPYWKRDGIQRAQIQDPDGGDGYGGPVSVLAYIDEVYETESMNQMEEEYTAIQDELERMANEEVSS